MYPFSPGKSLVKVLSFSLICALLTLEAAPAFAGSAASSAVPTNYDVLRGVSEKAARGIVDMIIEAPPGNIVLLSRAKGVGEADFLFENALLEQLREAGIRAGIDIKQEISADSGCVVLSYQVIRLDMRYTRISRRYWFGPKEVEREARADIAARLVDRRTGDILWMREGTGRYGDVIPYSLLEKVEEEQYGFTKPARDEFKMSRIIEPVIVAGVVIGLVALFFSNQSSND